MEASHSTCPPAPRLAPPLPAATPIATPHYELESCPAPSGERSLLWFAEMGELTLRDADFDSGFQILDPRNNRDARFRPDAGKETIAKVQRAAPAFQLNRPLFFVDSFDWCDTDQRPQGLDLPLTLLVALAVLLQFHLQQPFFLGRQVQD